MGKGKKNGNGATATVELSETERNVIDKIRASEGGIYGRLELSRVTGVPVEDIDAMATRGLVTMKRVGRGYQVSAA